MPFSDLPEGFGYFLPKLDGALQALKLAQDACDIPPVKVAIDSAVDLLDRILVFFPYPDKPMTHIVYTSGAGGLFNLRIGSYLGWPTLMRAKRSTRYSKGKDRMRSVSPPGTRLKMLLRESDQQCAHISANLPMSITEPWPGSRRQWRIGLSAVSITRRFSTDGKKTV